MKLCARHIIAAAVAAVVIVLIILCFTLPSCAGKLGFKTTFYYVCYDSPPDAQSASSVSSLVHSYGGAGYIIETGGKYYVTVACYYDDRDAQSVVATLGKKGLGCSVVKVEAGDFELRGSAKRNAEKFKGNLDTLLSLSRLCYDLANSLDSYSVSQSSAKSLLGDVGSGLSGLADINTANCFTNDLKRLKAECSDASGGYIFSHDVRRLQIAICDAITSVKIY
ncbi:MAG: hypothetical protein NC033_03465 [Clostridiales bacterium]|nr:hypothetical protein [Clostridiales bacterium]